MRATTTAFATTFLLVSIGVDAEDVPSDVARLVCKYERVDQKTDRIDEVQVDFSESKGAIAISSGDWIPATFLGDEITWTMVDKNDSVREGSTYHFRISRLTGTITLTHDPVVWGMKQPAGRYSGTCEKAPSRKF